MYRQAHYLAENIHELLPRVWAFSYRVLGSQGCAERTVYLASERAFERVHAWPAKLPVFHWLVSNLYHVWNDQGVNCFARGHAVTVNRRVCDSDCPAGDAFRSDVLGKLTQQERLILILIYHEKLEAAQVAAMLDMQVATVITHCYNARRALQ